MVTLADGPGVPRGPDVITSVRVTGTGVGTEGWRQHSPAEAEGASGEGRRGLWKLGKAGRLSPGASPSSRLWGTLTLAQGGSVP